MVSHHMAQAGSTTQLPSPKPLETYTPLKSWDLPRSPLLRHPCLLPVSDTPHPMLVWPHHLWLLPIAVLAILFAIGLAVTAPQDWPLTLRLSLALAYLIICSLLLGCYSVGGA